MPTNSGFVQTPLPILPKLFQGQISKIISKLLDEHSEHGTAMKIVKSAKVLEISNEQHNVNISLSNKTQHHNITGLTAKH